MTTTSELGSADSQATRDRIYIAAAKLFAERGYGGVSMREVAEVAGVSKPMLYYYFSSKLGLCKALIEEGLASMHRAIEETAHLPIEPKERLRLMVRERYRNVRENPDLVRFHIHFFMGPDETGLAAYFRSRHMTMMSALEEIISEGQTQGVFRPEIDPRLAANVFAGAVNVQIGQSLILGTPELDDELADGVTDMYLNGVSA
jgi:AcrR family transcriptional regulator